MNSKNGIALLVLTGLYILLTIGCKKETIPSITTTEVTKINSKSAQSGGNITSDGGSLITTRGVCWSTTPNPTTADSKTSDGTGSGSFTSVITGLMPNTLYYVRAYATNGIGTAYGNVISFSTSDCVVDIDGNVYNIINFNSQQWMAENLKVTHYRNGDSIPNITNGAEWGTLNEGAYCEYENQLSNNDIYGRLYNFYAVEDSRNLCPAGWHVPTQSEWQLFINNLGGDSVAGGKIKEIDTIHWASPNTGATNEIGFTALPGGYRNTGDGSFGGIRLEGIWYVSTSVSPSLANAYDLNNNQTNLHIIQGPKNTGLSVRCIKD